MKTGDKFYHQGEYIVENKDKYVGNKNPKYRSSWEQKFSYWCDHATNVLRWSYECFEIPYFSPIDNKVHRYFPDFYMELKNTEDKIIKYIVEVKPYNSTIPPKRPKRIGKSYLNQAKNYIVNKCKWESAIKFCAEKGYVFKLITENDLYIQ